MYFPKNYKKNSLTVLPEEYLNGQSLGELGKMRYGAVTVDDAGCGPLAVYNMLRYLKRPIPLANIIRELELYAAPLGARFGTSGLLLMIFFFRHHVRFRLRWRVKKIDQSRAGVLLYWTKRPVFSGGHFVFYQKNEEGRIAVYNRYSNRDNIHYYDSIRELVPQKRISMVLEIKERPGEKTC